MSIRSTVAGLCLVALALTACAGPSPAPSVTSGSPTPSATTPTGPVATIAQSGFGQQGQNVWVTALVTNHSAAPGQAVTVSFTLLDKAGKEVKKVSQSGTFAWAGQQLALGVQVDLDLDETRVAAVESELAVVEAGSDALRVDQFGAGPVTVGKSPYGGGFAATFDVINPSDTAVSKALLGIICYAQDASVVGGGTATLETVPAHGRVPAETSALVVSEKPASCKAFAGVQR